MKSRYVFVVFNQLGHIERSHSEGKEAEARELFIKEHYTDKIAKMMSSLQAADSKALNFHAEVRLHCILTLSSILSQFRNSVFME